MIAIPPLPLARWSTTQALWLGLTVLLALFAGAHFLTLRAARSVDTALFDLAGDVASRGAAAYQMKLGLDGMTQASLAYSGKPTARAQVTRAEAQVERAFQAYGALASAESSRLLAQQAGYAYKRYRRHVHQLIQLTDEQFARRADGSGLQQELQRLVADLPVTWSSRAVPSVRKRSAVSALSQGLRQLHAALGVDTVQQIEGNAQRLAHAQQAAGKALSEYRSLAESPEERRWATRAGRLLARCDGEREAASGTSALRQAALKNLIASRQALDRLLDEGVQPAARAEAQTAAQSLLNSARGAGRLIQYGLLAALMLAVLLALAASRAAQAPLRTLSGWTRRLAEGDLSFRAPAGKRGALAELTSAFNEMAARLQQTTQAQIDYATCHDPLTGLPNRVLLADGLRGALERARQSDASVAVLCLDLDDFKHVNDTLGHEEGDLLLQTVAGRLQRCMPPEALLARLGGDEFAVVLSGARREMARVAESAIAAVAAPLALSGLELRMQASAGISVAPVNGASADELLKAADAAMYHAKRRGRGGYEFFTAELTQRAAERLMVENALRHPRIFDELLLLYQPQVEVASGRVVGVESLIRWQHPTRGVLQPHAFIPLAEETGLIHAIGEWVLRTACAQAGAWSTAGVPLRVAVNVSPQQLQSDRIMRSVELALRAARLSPSLLELEVTEGALQTGPEVSETLARLKRIGVRLALDDFGTGYSGLGSLKALPFDCLKIDRSFLRDLAQGPQDRAIAQAIIAMGRSLDLDVVAEGVESENHLTFLREQRCEVMQGYLIGAPMTAAELAVWMQSHWLTSVWEGRPRAGAGRARP